jgi:predicted Zn-dependent protease
MALELTWIALGGKVYRITGMTRPESFEAMRPAFRETAESFGALTSAERGTIRETRIRLVRARGGETLSTLLAQAGSVWSPDYAAVANDLDTAAVLAPRLVKVGVARAPRMR